jgi:hypothetical protein
MLGAYRKFWWALYVGLLCLFSMRIFVGPMGRREQAVQQQELALMQDNYQQLQELQARLEATKYDHENNEETMILAARKVGFFRADEQLIVVRGLDNSVESWDVGHVVWHQSQANLYARWYGTFIFVVGFCLTLILQFFLAKAQRQDT